ncbi:MAG: hypothetical protein Q4D51_03450 [Eubacteriales bacterium]|nr:hypothetical protein [Eubacteriales bacterium]
MDKKEVKTQKINTRNVKMRWIIGGLGCLSVLMIGLVWGVKLKHRGADAKKAFQVGDEIVYMDEVNFCILQNMLQLQIDSKALSVETEDGTYAEEYFKDEIQKSITIYKVESMLAKKEGITLSEENEQSVNGDVAMLMGKIQGKAFHELGISTECIKSVLTQQYLARKYEQMCVKDIEIEKEHYCTMYLLLFPKIKADENGEFIMEEDGETPVLLDQNEITMCKAQADAARIALEAGEDAEELAKQYGVEAFSGEQSCLAGSFDEAFVTYAKQLKKGECSPVVETASCFGIAKMISEQDEEIEKQIYDTHRQELEKEKIAEKRKEWYEQLGVQEGLLQEWNAWKETSLYDFVKYVED